ncbi:MAG TPA: DNA polymerase IV [Nitrospirota bacterium]|nr:DNA polymerase IV [Nitrospirota bacterium]
MQARSVLHIDMNAFFASVEQRANPTLRNKAMAVIGSAHRGVILSPSYEARAFGVKTGMTYGEAMRACPKLRLVPADPAKYSHTCEELVEIWKEYSPLVELFSIDEAFLDVTGCEELFGDSVQIAIRIKERIWNEKGLTCSIGIAPNKLLAKLGSDMQKPDGLVLISPDDIDDVLENTAVKSLCGIGPSIAGALAAMGIRSCGELGRTPVARLTDRFGIVGERLRDMGLGVDRDPVIPLQESFEEEAKSVGHSMTLTDDCSDVDRIEQHILQLAEKIGRRLRRGSYHGRTVSLTLRYTDFRTFSRQTKLRHAVNHGLDIHAAARELLHSIPLAGPVRLVGVSVSQLEKNYSQMPLFGEERKRRFIAETMDTINDRYGDFTVTWGTLVERYRHGRVLSPAWRPAGDRRY